MSKERGIGRTEILIGIAVVAVLALITIPLVMSSNKDGQRQQLIQHVDEIRTAEIMYKEAFEEYVPADAAPRAPNEVGPDPVPWEPTPGFVKLAWEPQQEEVHGSYRVKAGPDGFTVIGTADLDGDGVRARVEATESESARLVTESDVY